MGDTQGNFRKVYFEHRILVFNLALHYVLNIEDAEEITQDVFVKVHASYEQFKNESSLKTWIYRITVNQSLDFIKRRDSKKRFFIFGRKSSSEKEYLDQSTFEHPGIALEDKEKSALLFSIIDQLPETQKTAFLLSKLEGLGNPEIAAIMETSIGAVESLLVRAKRTLQEKLDGKFDGYRRKK
jgi:RNA polymerase sigma factor (sigma-70 family)